MSSALPVLLAAAAQQAANATPPGLALLQSATLWLDASDAVSGVQYLRNKGTGGRALDARFGSTGQAQIIGGALKLPGTTGNSATAPDSAPLSITGDLEIIAKVNLVDWTPDAKNVIVCKGDASAQDSYVFRVSATTGVLDLTVCNAAGTYIGAVSSAAPTVVDGADLWVRATVDIDNGANSVFKFYTSSDGSSWTQLGTTQTATRITTSVRDGTSTLNIGCYANGVQHLAGSIYRVIIKDGYDGAGTTVFDADFTAQSTLATSFTESSANAATVTINSTSGVDSNDPLLLTHSGTNYLYLSGSNGNYASAPDSAALDLTGDVELVVRVACTDWTPSAAGKFVTKRDSASVSNYSLGLDAAGTLHFDNAGGGSSITSSSAAVSFTDGQTGWVKVTYRNSDRRLQFFTAADQATEPSSWTQLGTDVTHTPTGGNVANTAALCIGGIGPSTSPGPAGMYYRVIVRNGIDGTTVFDADFTTNTNQSTFTESSSNAATVTINRATSGRKSVMVVRPTLLFGTDDYLEVADNALLDIGASDDLTAVVVSRKWGNGYTTTNGALIGKQAGGSSNGWRLQYTTTTIEAILDADVAITDTQTAPAAGDRSALAFIRDATGADTVSAAVGSTFSGTSDTSTTTAANADALTIGRIAGASPRYVDAEIDTVAVFRSALTTTDLANIMSYLGVS